MPDCKSLCAVVTICATLADPILDGYGLTPVTLKPKVKPKVTL